MRLYNTLTKSINDFQPIDEGRIRVYSCGPTVYDSAHIGNLSAYIFADTLRRVLTLNGYKVTQIMNYTDVDDKTVGRSQEKYPDLEPKEALNKLTAQYIELFLNDIKKIGVDQSAITFVRATENIDAMKQLITKLFEAKIAYITDDGIYFSIQAYKNAGKTYGQLLELSEQNTSKARIDNDEYDKESAHDFALWKKQKDGEPAWDLEIDGQNISGRPGWHIECSAMSEAALGLPFDIHTGGIDNIFPHHENEIAQSTAVAKSNKMANYFVHCNHVLVDGKKMAKSANNFYTLQDILDKGFDPLAFRLLVLQAHYKSEVNFTWDSLQSAQNSLLNIYAACDMKWQPALATDTEPAVSHNLENLFSTLSGDLQTPIALRELKAIMLEYAKDGVARQKRNDFQATLEKLDNAFGLGLSSRLDITDEQKDLINKRQDAKDKGNFASADAIRSNLAQQKIGLDDRTNGVRWYRI